ncbi:coiled-coil domain-containing protein 167 isoform X2 [Malaclemys terrapin pileata]|uniref:coiled-coil domain-containing protein 167 isoform X2 n=1 Tax=Malaclemys terrapin pileata TaxID=2991368 RepID=UPI0023A8BAF2|nr:coiled-coil domain-containing protein 167 isoform X2 [Malaclemys terrapin pileata]
MQNREIQIDGLEEKLSLCRQSMEEVDLKLRREELSPEGRKSLERERSLLVTKAETYASGSACSILCRERTKSAPSGKSQERSHCNGHSTVDYCCLHLLDNVIMVQNSHY